MTAAAPGLPAAARSGRAVPAGLVDGAFVVVLVGLGLVGFRSAYGGSAYLVVGVIGTVLGVAVTDLARHWRQPVVVEAVATLVVFLLVGGAVATPHSAVDGVLPTGHTISALGQVGIHGWKDLLTTAPPVGNTSDLLALPFFVGLIGGVVGRSVAGRVSSAAAPLIGPVAVLALGILFGTPRPASVLLQGSVFGGVAVAWVVIRYHRTRPVIARSGHRRSRWVLAVGLLALSAVAATVTGPRLPGAGSHARVVLSRYIVPPFEGNDQPSPLAGFRNYTKGSPESLYDTVLFTVIGDQPGATVRIATMDDYDGLVWGFGAGLTGRAGRRSGDVFRRFGSVIPISQSGPSRMITVRIDALGGVWMPEEGEVTHLASGRALAGDFVYDTATDTAADPAGLQPGDKYTMAVVVPSVPSKAALSAAASGGASVATSGVPSVVSTDAALWAGGASGAWAKVISIATYLRTYGEYSDGLENPPLSLPGASAGRLASFVEGGPLVGQHIVGDDEQYAATLALMADAVGVPARVVLGAVVEQDGQVRGRDVHAWVEVSLAGLGWVPVYQNDFLPTTPAHEVPSASQGSSVASAPAEPPVVSAFRSPTDEAPASSPAASIARPAAPRRHPAFRVPGYVVTAASWFVPPVVAVALALGTIVALKARRRRRRRRATAASARVAGGWNELVDLARDIGLTVPAAGTRSEQARTFNELAAAGLARRADAAVFGPGEPSPVLVDDYWTSVNYFGRELRASLTRWGRWRAALSLRSFRFSERGGVIG